ncbi:MAG: phosphatidylglycerophosphatase A [candidate division Zixibacteria bacterium]|nr:phosphatidylglycerophosphatase A [candidate division Zixibacteria bacterium]
MAGPFLRRLATFVASVGYLGYSPVAPGTVGTLAAAAVYWWLVPANYWVLVVAAAAIGAGVWAGGAAEKVWGGDDPRRACIDEFAAYFVAVAFLPKAFSYAVLAFILSRALDIAKPFPAGRLQRVRGGVGIMADDLVAAVYANLTLQALRLLARALGASAETFP